MVKGNKVNIYILYLSIINPHFQLRQIRQFMIHLKKYLKKNIQNSYFNLQILGSVFSGELSSLCYEL